MSKIYNILLDGVKIGTTLFENADPPMGVIFGRINFVSPNYDYKFFKDYCLNKSIRFQNQDNIEFIQTYAIPTLQIRDINGKLIEGEASSIDGMNSEYYNVSVLGIPYPFYQEEFPHHVADYETRFKL